MVFIYPIHTFDQASYSHHCSEATRLLRRVISVAYVPSVGYVCQTPSSFEIFGWMYVYYHICLYFKYSKSKLLRFGRTSTIKMISMWRENLVSCQKPRFRGQRVWKQVNVAQIPITKADFFCRIFEAIPRTLRQMWLSVQKRKSIF